MLTTEFSITMTPPEVANISPAQNQSTISPPGLFPNTQWSVISRARNGEESQAIAGGLRDLATNYWRPLYLYLRKRGENHEDASDSVQGFFEFVFSTGFLSHVDREGGKFRSYLLKSLERWRSRRRVHNGAQKRGGHVVHVPLEGVEDLRNAAELSDDATPEVAFDRRWASEMVARAVVALEDDYSARDRVTWFNALRSGLPGGGQLPPYLELAETLGASEGAIKKAVHDLRQGFATHLRQEIRATVRTNEDAEEELRYLISVLAGA